MNKDKIMRSEGVDRDGANACGFTTVATTSCTASADRQHTLGLRVERALSRLTIFGFALAALSIVPTLARGGDSDTKDNTEDASVYGGGDDETVGTLPIVVNGQQITLHRNLSIQRASVCLEGNLDEVLNCIAVVRGNSAAKFEWIDAASRRARLTFPNDVQLGFDRLALQSTNVRIGMSLPKPYAYPIDWVGSFNSRHGAFSPAVTVAEIPLAALAQSGTLDLHPLHVQAGNFRTMTSLTAIASADLVLLRQTH